MACYSYDMARASLGKLFFTRAVYPELNLNYYCLLTSKLNINQGFRNED